MTGRRLYDRYCDARKRHVWNSDPLPAWPWLDRREQDVWRSMAKSIRDRARLT